jgi:hypothetical protein
MVSKEGYKDRVLDILCDMREGTRSDGHREAGIGFRELCRRLGQGSPNYIKKALDYWVDHGYVQPPRGYSLSESVLKENGEYWLREGMEACPNGPIFRCE